ncbi:MAG: hypothetical protein IJY04_10460 [Clostridia bacterium]|nr:hypothetical protein [Clostridia bacterium]
MTETACGNKPKNTFIAHRSTLEWIMLALAYFLPVIASTDKRLLTLVSVLYLGIIAYFAFSERFFLLYPILFFFYEYLVAPGGIVVYRFFTVIFILRFIYLHFGVGIRNLSRARTAIALFLLLTAVSYFLRDGSVTVGALIDLLFLLLFTCETAEENSRFSPFAISMVLATCAACVSGFIADSEILNALGGDDRFLATLNDPNYLGFYLNTAILIVILHPFFKKLLLKLPTLTLLYISMVATESMTGFICNAIVLIFCVVILASEGKFKLRYAVAVTVTFAVALQIVLLAAMNDWGIISSASARFTEKLSQLISGDLSSFTTSRSDIWKINLRQFLYQDTADIIFGDNLLSAIGRNATLYHETSHQEFIDVLISTGVVGFFIFLVLIAAFISNNLSEVRREHSSDARIRLGIKLIWAFYALALTMFLKSGFYIIFLL